MKDARFSVLSSGRWPSGEEKAVGWIQLEHPEVERRNDIHFQRGRDELDDFWEIGCRLQSGRLVRLESRPRPEYGIDVYADITDDGVAAMRELGGALGLSAAEFTIFTTDAGGP